MALFNTLLPTEIQSFILLKVIYSEGPTAFRLREVCKAWKTVLDDQTTWSNEYKRLFTNVTIETNACRELLQRLTAVQTLMETIQSPQQQLIEAIKSGYKGGVNAVLNRIPPSTSLDDEEDTALHILALKAPTDIAMAQLLIDKGAPVNSQNLYGSTPLHLAVKAPCAPLVALLLANSADKTLVENTPPGETPRTALQMAVPNSEIAKLL